MRMAANGGSDFRNQVLQAIDIVELVGQSVALKRRGRSFVGLCPFHQEKTPSFHVHPAKQFFHCFGCKATGNAIDFVMKRDRIEFLDALKLLGAKAGIEMPKFGVSKQNTSQRQMLLEAHSAACALFEKLLSHPQQGEAARQYLAKRGFTPESIQRFQVGLAASSWDYVLSSLARKFTPQQLHEAGLVKAREAGQGHYDTFRNRLIFPIRDESSRIIAFGGRIMPGSEDPAKYLNSPETPLFSKSRCLFGLDLARQRIVETRTACVVEGYTDVVMAHQFGISNVVSALGTALTEQHVSILKRFADRIVLLFDADAAGDMAADRVVELFLSADVQIAVATMPQGMDPDEFLLKHGAAEFDKLLSDAPDALSHVWKQMIRQFLATEDNVTNQQKAAEKYLDLLGAARGTRAIDSLRWGSIIADASKKTKIPADVLFRRFAPKRRSRVIGGAKVAPAQVAANAQPTVSIPAGPTDGLVKAQRQVLGALLAEPGRWHDVQQRVHLEDFTDESCRKLAELYWSYQRNEGEPQFRDFLGVLPDEQLKELAVVTEDEFAEMKDAQTILDDALKHLKDERESRERNAVLKRTTDPNEWLKLKIEQGRKGNLRIT
jgi:DNA primase